MRYEMQEFSVRSYSQPSLPHGIKIKLPYGETCIKSGETQVQSHYESSPLSSSLV